MSYSVDEQVFVERRGRLKRHVVAELQKQIVVLDDGSKWEQHGAPHRGTGCIYRRPTLRHCSERLEKQYASQKGNGQ